MIPGEQAFLDEFTRGLVRQANGNRDEYHGIFDSTFKLNAQYAGFYISLISIINLLQQERAKTASGSAGAAMNHANPVNNNAETWRIRQDIIEKVMGDVKERAGLDRKTADGEAIRVFQEKAMMYGSGGALALLGLMSEEQGWIPIQGGRRKTKKSKRRQRKTRRRGGVEEKDMTTAELIKKIQELKEQLKSVTDHEDVIRHVHHGESERASIEAKIQYLEDLVRNKSNGR